MPFDVGEVERDGSVHPHENGRAWRFDMESEGPNDMEPESTVVPKIVTGSFLEGTRGVHVLTGRLSEGGEERGMQGHLCEHSPW